jgi:uncharacterized protein YhbP (UPF0306 family)
LRRLDGLWWTAVAEVGPSRHAGAPVLTLDNESLAARLIATQRTMTIATADPKPWAAPVYYLARDGRFFFFSNSESRHVTEAIATSSCAASIYRDSDDWREIEGLQMDGEIQAVPIDNDATEIFRAYVDKFPSVRSFFADEAIDLSLFLGRFRSKMFGFTPRRLYYLNNQAGLGSRKEIQLSF